jgi:phospholipase/carboxylesterase
MAPTIGLSSLGLEEGRDGELYVPSTYSPDTPSPLFVVLHGAGGNGAFWSSYHDRAAERGMILLAPDSRNKKSWDLMVQSRFGKDVRFIDRALQHTFDRCRVDPTRIALGGFSDGASYTLSLGPSNGDLFTHLVAYSPGYFQIVPPVVGKPSIFISHGSDDQILSPFHTKRNIVPAFADSGYDVIYQEFFGGHAVPSSITEMALDWFLEA